MRSETTLRTGSGDGVELLVDEGARARGVLVAFSNRRGGVSRPPFDGLNLAASVGDRRADVMTNRARVARAAGFDAGALVLARQVHGCDLLVARRGDSGVLGEADGLIAREPGVVLGILTADCAPVLIAGPGGVAVLHAGWRGLVAGVIERGLEALGEVSAAWVGPCIHSCCYEVGPEVVDAFAARALPVAGDRRVDPSDAARAVLENNGVASVVVAADCTHCDGAYFSYRREATTGRQGGFVALLDEERS